MDKYPFFPTSLPLFSFPEDDIIKFVVFTD